ncbi:uncharacterized protein EAE97_011717 [Botrytis byssoidea]|uniref:Heterokaryon incompatibility domain-containing protein n=1 Tax=Botrytis byssoidea TaxID=139641 RepID=A0A9P5LGU0_9HELO|nr:uncharacterized protein EAE97_011717 [Botrytis byssoidea]KAF7919385.1 hypothetical protein EAE97_011717 [Botrytis byssoidea]
MAPKSMFAETLGLSNILPAKSERFYKALACIFKYVSLVDDLETSFTALSHTWGDVVPDEDHPNGELIAKGLSDSSRALSSEPNTVDGVPVNIVWPNIPHYEGQKELAAIIDSFGNDHWSTTQSLLRSHKSKLITILQNPQLGECWEALEEIHKSPYWNRLWIVQEVLINSETWVYVGEELIPLALGQALQYLDNSEIETLPPYTTYVIESVRIPANLPLLDGKLHFSDPIAKHMELLDIHQTFRKFECRDPRDKVYGIAGLSYSYHQKLMIDYSKSVSEMYKDVARLITETIDRLEIICAGEKTKCHCPSGSYQGLSTIATWVPNWSCIREGTGLCPGHLRG